MRLPSLVREDIDLPCQDRLCEDPLALCGIVHVECPSAGLLRGFIRLFHPHYEKRLAVLLPNGRLLIYKYYLLGVGAGTPLIGNSIDLTTARIIRVVRCKDKLQIEIVDHSKQQINMYIEGKTMNLWAAKFFMYTVSGPHMHLPHDPPINLYKGRSERSVRKTTVKA